MIEKISHRGKKTSSEKIVEVITAKINNPDLSLRDIEKETGVNRQTASDILNNEMDIILTTSDKKRSLLDVNISILEEGKKIIEEQIKLIGKEGGLTLKNITDLRTLSSTLEDAFKQNQLLQDKPTDNIQINDYKTLSTEELLKRKNG